MSWGGNPAKILILVYLLILIHFVIVSLLINPSHVLGGKPCQIFIIVSVLI